MENCISYRSANTQPQLKGYHTSSFLRTCPPLRPKHFRWDGSFKFVEMSGFLTICFSLNILHIFNGTEIAIYIYIFIYLYYV